MVLFGNPRPFLVKQHSNGLLVDMREECFIEDLFNYIFYFILDLYLSFFAVNKKKKRNESSVIPIVCRNLKSYNTPETIYMIGSNNLKLLLSEWSRWECFAVTMGSFASALFILHFFICVCFRNSTSRNWYIHQKTRTKPKRVVTKLHLFKDKEKYPSNRKRMRLVGVHGHNDFTMKKKTTIMI